MSIVKPPPNADVDRESSADGWRRRARALRPAASVVARGEPTLWLTAGALAIAIAMIVGLIALVVIMGGTTFWPARLVEVELGDGRVLLGQVADREMYQISRDELGSLPEEVRSRAEARMGSADEMTAGRTLLRVDNKDITGETYLWINDLARKQTRRPEWGMTLERTEWGRFLGYPRAFTIEHPRPISGTEEQLTRLIDFFQTHRAALTAEDSVDLTGALERLQSERAAARAQRTAKFLQSIRNQAGGGEHAALLDSGEEIPLASARRTSPIASVRATFSGPAASWKAYQTYHPQVMERAERIDEIDNDGLGDLSGQLEAARMATVRAGIEIDASLEPIVRRLAERDARRAALDREQAARRQIVAAAVRRFGEDAGVTEAARSVVGDLNAGTESTIESVEKEITEIEATIPKGGGDAIDTYREKAAAIRAEMAGLSPQLEELKNRNDDFQWRLAVSDGSMHQIAVAEIVRAYPANQVSVWGRLGVYFDRWGEFLLAEPREANMEGGVFPAIWGTVAMTLIMTIAVVPFGVLAALYLREYAKAGPLVSAVRIAVNNLAGVPSIVFGVFGLGFFCYVVGARVDQIFYPEYVAQNKPVFETGGLLWASLTLALLTLPVVIVATEEALAAVPNSMREGSYACGASKWQTIRRIILPRALPGMMTGMILAMARGAGEVAPLMLVGAVKIAPALPVDAEFPFVHPSRSFMHLGFHIYDLGFQSPDSEAAKPMVFTTTLLLITIVGVLNISAILIRNRLRRRFASSQF